MIFGDDIGWFNTSAYNDGIMGYRTPNIDRIAEEGVRFTDYYGENSCTAGRAAFITGQSPYRTGLLKVGLPRADMGLVTDFSTTHGVPLILHLETNDMDEMSEFVRGWIMNMRSSTGRIFLGN